MRQRRWANRSVAPTRISCIAVSVAGAFPVSRFGSIRPAQFRLARTANSGGPVNIPVISAILPNPRQVAVSRHRGRAVIKR